MNLLLNKMWQKASAACLRAIKRCQAVHPVFGRWLGSWLSITRLWRMANFALNPFSYDLIIFFLQASEQARSSR